MMDCRSVSLEGTTPGPQPTSTKEKPGLFRRLVNSLLKLHNKSPSKGSGQPTVGKTDSDTSPLAQKNKQSSKEKGQIENNQLYASHVATEVVNQKIGRSDWIKQAQNKRGIAGQKESKQAQQPNTASDAKKSSQATQAHKPRFGNLAEKLANSKMAESGVPNEKVSPEQSDAKSANAAYTRSDLNKREAAEPVRVGEPAWSAKKSALSKNAGLNKEAQPIDLNKSMASFEKNTNDLNTPKIQVATPFTEAIQTGLSTTTVSETQIEVGTTISPAASQTVVSASPAAHSSMLDQTTYPDLSQQLAARVARALQRGDSTFKIHLHPPELGEVQVIFKQAEGKLHVTLACAQAQTCTQLQDELEQLERRLAESGVDQAEVDVRHQTSHSGDQRDWEQDSQSGVEAKKEMISAPVQEVSRDRAGLIVVA